MPHNSTYSGRRLLPLETKEQWQEELGVPANAAAVPFTPAGDIAADNVQDAIEELDTEKVPTARTLTAGAGLTGGGTLAADRTFAVGAGTAITVNADDVALDIASQAEAEAGELNNKGMTPLRTAQAIAALASAGGFPPGHIFGLTLSNAAVDTTNDITIQPGSARDENNTEDLVLSAALTKQIDASWAVGTNQGGMNTGSVANSTWYEVLLIKRTDTGVVDVMFSTTANRNTLPGGYSKKRRIGWVRRGVGTNLQFTQVEDYFTLTTQINDVAANMTSTATQAALTVPPNTVARFRAGASAGASASGTIVFSEIVEGDVTPNIGTGICSLTVTVNTNDAGYFELRVNGSSQIEHDAAITGTPTFDISTFGWIDRRGRLA